jgi:shikimate dehydrogenase
MIHKIGLIGKNIGHSKSEEVYKSLLKEFKFEKLDYSELGLIPPLKQFFNKGFTVLHVTSPYKQSFSEQMLESYSLSYFDDNFTNSNPINLVVKRKEDLIGYNTDILALLNSIRWMNKKMNLKNKEIAILGDGSMSHVLRVVLDFVELKYKIFSRKLGNIYEEINSDIIFNCCSRGFYISEIKKIHSDIFFDLNYSDILQENLCKERGLIYQDGMEILKMQAKYAFEIWYKNRSFKEFIY